MMELMLLWGITLAAGGGLFFWLQRWDRQRLDRAGTVFLFWFLGAGALSVLPGFLLYFLAANLTFLETPGRWGDVLFIWTVNAPVEELAKYLCFVLVTAARRSLREPQDGVLQGATTGLGFGLVENLLYGFADGWQTLAVRTLFSLPGHLIYGAVWGGYHGFEVYQGRGRVVRWWVPLLALVPAAFSHATFNTLVLVDAPLVLALAGDALTLAFGLFLFFRLRAVSPSRLRRPLREWRQAIPEIEHALALNPQSPSLRRRLAAYLLAGQQPDKALLVLAPLSDDPWTRFYRSAAVALLDPGPRPLPPESSLNLPLYRRLSGG